MSKKYIIYGIIIVVVIFSLLAGYGFYLEKQDQNISTNSQDNMNVIDSLLGFLSGSDGAGVLDSTKYFLDPKVASFVDDIQKGNVDRVKAALAGGINANTEGNGGFRPIYFVFVAKNPDVLKLILTAGADPNARLLNGNTPLHFSVRHSNLEFTRVLLAAGADPNGRGENDKPHIHEAIDQVNPGHLSLLATAGADINVVWADRTPVMSTLQIGQWKMASVLIDLGANLQLKNKLGETALDLACRLISRIPVSDANRNGIASVVKSLSQRKLILPCEAEVVKFK